MRDGIYLEIIACSLTDAIAAEQGGADRIELISHYEVGGLTPPLDLVRAVVAAVSIPVRVMLRDAESFFVPDKKDRAILERTARELNQLPIDGLVFGFLRRSGSNGQTEIDLELVGQLLDNAPDLRVTFHRASEALPDPGTAIETLHPYPRIDTLLTSGGPEPWAAKVDRFRDWTARAAPEKTILVGGGVDEAAIQVLRPATLLHAFHLGLAVRAGRQIDGPVLATEVSRLAELIRSSGPLSPCSN